MYVNCRETGIFPLLVHSPNACHRCRTQLLEPSSTASPCVTEQETGVGNLDTQM